MQADRSAKTSGRLAALAQAGLAALVAGSLLSFSMIAFNTAFDQPATSRGIDVSAPRTAPSAPVVLPTPPQDETEVEPVAAVAAAPEAAAIVAVAPEATVLGTRTERPTRKDKKKKDRRTWSFPEGGRKLSGYGGGSQGGDSDDGHKNTTGNGHDKARGQGHQKDLRDANTNNGSVDRGRSKAPKNNPKKGKKH